MSQRLPPMRYLYLETMLDLALVQDGEGRPLNLAREFV